MFCDDVLTTVSVQEISTVLEGVSRPTHFSGVATIVAKLLILLEFAQLISVKRIGNRYK